MITVITFESSPLSGTVDKTFESHFETHSNGFCVVKTYDIDFLSYAEKQIKAHYVWTIQLRHNEENRYLNQATQQWLDKSHFVDWIMESYPDSFEWLLFNPEWLA